MIACRRLILLLYISQTNDKPNLKSPIDEKEDNPGADKADKYAMTYGSTTAEKKRHLLRTSTTPMGIKQEFSYDDFGNTVMSKTVTQAIIR